MKHSITLALTVLATSACLDDKAPAIDCGQGDAVAYRGAAYCVYAAAIIIEGFDCPADAPFGQGMGDLFICAPSSTPPDGGWQGVIDEWRPAHSGGPDVGMPEVDATAETAADSEVTADISDDMTDAADVGPDSPGICVQGLTPGACWDDSQCPEAWLCASASALGCTPCGDCPDPVPGYAGTCRPSDTTDALGLVAWPHFEGAAGDVPIALWWLETPYALLDCPSFELEWLTANEYLPGPAERACSGPVFGTSNPALARVGVLQESFEGTATTRARGRYLTSCVGLDPQTCQGQAELVSEPVVLRKSAP